MRFLKVAAKRIIEHRESNGKFEQVEQLLDVDKIETVTLEKYCREAFFHLIFIFETSFHIL